MSLGKHLEGYTVDEKGRTLDEVYMLYVEAHEACKDTSLTTSKMFNIKKRDKLQSRFIAFIVKILVNGGIYYVETGENIPTGVKVSCYVHKRSLHHAHDILDIHLTYFDEKWKSKHYTLTYWGNCIETFNYLRIAKRNEQEHIYHEIMRYLPEEFKIFLNSHLPCTC